MFLQFTIESLKANTVSARIGPVSKPPAMGLSPAPATATAATGILNLLLIVLSSKSRGLE
ncbi:hypothetical protein RND71_027757 [Anisodus tanguticus]|uniref:Uncharacterized protein n=1 Tax=Anisodus tanguticus TaxID=243964 RepID=A0AAE1V8G6_9SOLA|nr:hypothetical protein RND71_027757 [Anisodus tanguticus]